MPSDLSRAFEALARAFLSSHPDVPHEWREVKSWMWGESVELICGTGPPDDVVFAAVYEGQIAVGLGSGEHKDFEEFGRGVSDEEVAREAFEHFLGLLGQHGYVS